MNKNIEKIIDLLKNKNFNIILNVIFIYPFLYLIESNWEKYRMIALILGVFILIKDIIIIKIDYFNKTYLTTNKLGISFLYKILRIIFYTFLFFIQYSKKNYVKYNTWICGILYFNQFIKIIKKIFNLNKIIYMKKK